MIEYSLSIFEFYIWGLLCLVYLAEMGSVVHMTKFEFSVELLVEWIGFGFHD